MTMGTFTYQIKESCWRDVFVRYDDDELNELIQTLKDEGRNDDYIESEVVDWLKENDDEDYGDADDYETEDWNYDLNDDDDVYNVAYNAVNNFVSSSNKSILGGLEDE